MAYLTESELTIYCSLPGITIQDVINASALVDSIKGKSFLEKTYVEQVKLTKKRQGYFTIYKGRLQHYPRASIVSVTSKTPGHFGGITTTAYATSSLVFDADDEPYFQFCDDTTGAHSVFPRVQPLALTVEYKAGYKADSIPEELKVICGMICDNVRSNGGYRSYKSRQDYDMTVSFSDKQDSVLTTNIIRMIDAIPLA